MSVIDDITALLTPVLHTNTTKDITAAAVRTALITAFTDIVNDIPDEVKAGAAALNASDFAGSLNLFDISRATANRLVSGGSLVTESGTYASDFIAVVPGGTITTNLTWGGGRGPNFFDKAQAYISDAAPSAGTPVTVPANAYYVRVSVPTTPVNGVSKDNYMIVRGSSLPADSTSFGIPGKRLITDIARKSVQRRVTQFADLANFRAGQVRSKPTSGLWSIDPLISGATMNAALDGLTGNVYTSGFDGWLVTDYFMVTPGGHVTIGLFGNTSVGHAFYDKDGIYISGVNGPFTEGQALSVPANAEFMRATINTTMASAGSGPSRAYFVDGSVGARHVFQSMPSLVHMHRPWTGKVWSFHGDSMSATRTGNSWSYDAAMYHGVRLVKNVAGDGRNTGDLLKHVNVGGVGASPALETTFFDDVDCVFVLVGTNDYVIGKTLGAITDATTAGTFYGDYKKFIEFVLTNNPYLRIVLATPMYRAADSNPYAIAPYQAAVRDLCQHYAIKLWDVAVESQLSAITCNAYTNANDGLHPAYHVGNIPPAGTSLIGKDVSSLLIYGSSLRGLMHNVMPVDFVGDPIYPAGGNTDYVPEIF
jgi:hypothetical protein